MHLLHGSSMVGGGCGGGRALRRVDSSPRPSSLCRSDTMKKKQKRSKRSRLSAVLRELKVAAKAKDKDGLLQILATGHRAIRGGSDDGAGTSTERSVAGTGAEQRVALWRQQGGLADAAAKTGGPLVEFGRPPAATGGRGNRCASWVLTATLVLALACVVAMGTAPAICCCTCVAWLCGDRRRGSCNGRVTKSIIQPQGGGTLYQQEKAADGRVI